MSVAISAPVAHAEFPPEGTISEASNPSVATGDLQDPAHKGVMRHYIFYFDCGKRDWIGVPVADTKASQGTPPQAVGRGREFPSGPPLGAKREAGNSNHATVAATGQSFVFQKGNWFDAKTGKLMRSPRLCPEGIAPSDQGPAKQATDTNADGRKLPAVQTAPPGDQKSDQLPPPPKFMPDRASSSDHQN